jgi:hypothetical protein
MHLSGQVLERHRRRVPCARPGAGWLEHVAEERAGELCDRHPGSGTLAFTGAIKEATGRITSATVSSESAQSSLSSNIEARNWCRVSTFFSFTASPDMAAIIACTRSFPQSQNASKHHNRALDARAARRKVAGLSGGLDPHWGKKQTWRMS